MMIYIGLLDIPSHYTDEMLHGTYVVFSKLKAIGSMDFLI